MEENKILVRSDNMIIQRNEILDRWFYEATKIYDQALFYLRHDFFEQKKKMDEANENGTTYTWINRNWQKGEFSLYSIVKKSKFLVESLGGKITVPSSIYRNVVSPKGIITTWKTASKARRDYWKTPSKYNGVPELPYYLEKRGRSVPLTFYRGSGDFKSIDSEKRTVIIGNSSSENNWIELHVPELVDFNTFTCIKLIKYYDKVKVIFIYEKEHPENNLDKGNVLGIDLGVRNIVSMTLNGKNLEGSWIVKGGVFLSILQFYNKRVSQCKTILDNTGCGKTSKRIMRLNKKKIQKLDYETHCLTKRIVDFCVEKGVGKIVVGHNDKWKKNVGIGKKNNQKFVQLPFSDIIWKLKYKGEERGIEVVETEESYTSKVDHLAKEDMKHHEKYAGKRGDARGVGTFYSSCGKTVNADINGAIGMLRKTGDISDEQLERMKSRSDITSPGTFQYKPKQGSINGVSSCKKSSWNGDESARRFEKEREKHVISLPNGVSPKTLTAKKTEIDGMTRWVIVDKSNGSMVLDGNGHGFKSEQKATYVIRYIRDTHENPQNIQHGNQLRKHRIEGIPHERDCQGVQEDERHRGSGDAMQARRRGKRSGEKLVWGKTD